MSNRRKLRSSGRRIGAVVQAPSGSDWFNRTARKTCSECGAAVKWVDAQAARDHGLDLDKALGFLGTSSPEEVECWVCTACDNAGVMGPATWG